MTANRIRHTVARLGGPVAAVGGIFGVISFARAVPIPVFALVLMLVSGATVLTAVLTRPLGDGCDDGWGNRIGEIDLAGDRRESDGVVAALWRRRCTCSILPDA
ncbi:hypothetical protein PXH69_21665 [Rhodococcus qingshengii]|uniref:Uncharacterized protein n=1 Tax=Rhodococcus qingshengii TaxID=334542 RepID=A0AAW6LQP4_RHOSG|nr:hypothetical protein [Rhodococcus qingshengii]MDE8647586.1 hypothetical protein [Rhodococcus qingshengii]